MKPYILSLLLLSSCTLTSTQYQGAEQDAINAVRSVAVAKIPTPDQFNNTVQAWVEFLPGAKTAATKAENDYKEIYPSLKTTKQAASTIETIAETL